MCMQIICLIGVFSLVLPVTACGGNPEIDIGKNAKQQLAPLPGKIGITLKNASGESHYVIQQGKFLKIDSLPRPKPEAATILRKSLDPPAGLLSQTGYVYWGPYLASPDGRYMAASIATERPALGSPGFVIVDKQANKTIALSKGEDNIYIESLAWSPNSQWVALLKASSQLTTLDRFLISLTGHADPRITWYLEVINLAGDVVVRSKLIDLRGSWGWLVWME
jgi:hypothetical protein